MKKALSILTILLISAATQAQSFGFGETDSISRKFSADADSLLLEFEQYSQKAFEEYQRYETGMRAEYSRYVSSIRQMWGADSIVDNTPSEWIEYGNDFKSRSVVDFENGDASVEVVLDNVDENDTEEVEKLLAEAIERMLESKGSSNPYNNKGKGTALTSAPILDGLLDLSAYDIEKSSEAEAPKSIKKRKTPPSPTVKSKKLDFAEESKESDKGNESAGDILSRIAENERKLKEEARKIALAERQHQEEAKRIALAEKKQKEAADRIASIKKEQLEREREKIAKAKKEQEEEAKRIADAKKKQEEEGKRIAEAKKKQQEEEKKLAEARKKQQSLKESSVAKKEQKVSNKDIAKAIAKQSKKSSTTVKGEDNKVRKVVKVEMALVSDNLSKNAALYKDIVKKHSAKFSIEEPLIFAIMEQESHFNPEARSWVPAFGLMQLVPKSGGYDAYRYVHKRDWVPTMEYLYVPQQNIELGTAYLRILSNMFTNVKDDECRRLCVIAGYNTGAGNVCRAFTGKTSIKGAVEHINKYSYEELYDHLTKKLSTDEARKYVSGVSKKREKYLKK